MTKLITIAHPRFVQNTLQVELKAAMFTAGTKLLLAGQVQPGRRHSYTVTDDAGKPATITLKFNFADPIPLQATVDGDVVILANPLKWYEYAFAIVPAMFLLSGGALGGGLGAVAAYVNCQIFRKDYSPTKKYVVSALVSLGAWVGFVVIILLLATLFPNLFNTH